MTFAKVSVEVAYRFPYISIHSHLPRTLTGPKNNAMQPEIHQYFRSVAEEHKNIPHIRFRSVFEKAPVSIRSRGQLEICST